MTSPVGVRSSASPPVLEVCGISKRYGARVALDDVSFAVEAGSIVSVLGRNGAGKTTLMSIIVGLRRPDSGIVRLDGVDGVEVPEQVRREIGIAGQELAVYPTLTVTENLAFMAELAGLRGRSGRARIEEVATALDLIDLLDRPARDTSGGEQRRLHAGMAMTARPRVLLLDEPTVGVDVESRGLVLDLVRRLAADGAAIVYTTHYLAEVEALDPGVVILDRGRVVATGSVAELVAGEGGSLVEVRFETAPVDVADAPWSGRVDGDVVRFETGDVAGDLPGIVAWAGARGHVAAVEVVRPGLETAFLSITGRRIRAGEAP